VSGSIAYEGVFETLFGQAVIDNFYEELDSLPPNDELAKQYTFSQEHEIRMNKLFSSVERKEKLQASVRWTRRIAAVVVIAATLLFGSLMFVPQVRAVVFQTLSEWNEKFVRFTSNAPEAEKTNLEPGYIPEGFVVIEREEIPGISIIVYESTNTGETIMFQSSLASGSTSVNNEGMVYAVIEVDSIQYNLLISENGVSENYIIWEADDQRYVITSTITQEELIEMALSVK